MTLKVITADIQTSLGKSLRSTAETWVAGGGRPGRQSGACRVERRGARGPWSQRFPPLRASGNLATGPPRGVEIISLFETVSPAGSGRCVWKGGVLSHCGRRRGLLTGSLPSPFLGSSGSCIPGFGE